jgi:hypothetical protein
MLSSIDPTKGPTMELRIATEVQINPELVADPYEYLHVIAALAVVLHKAAGHPIDGVRIWHHRIVVQVPRLALEEAAMIECPERVEAGQIVFFDPRV